MQQFGIAAGSSFVPVQEGQQIDLTDLVGKGYEAYGYCEGWISVQTLNEYGQTLKTYQWMDDGQGEFAEWYGWYPEGAGDPSEKIAKGTVTIQPGEGLWVYCTEDGFSIQSAGQVPTANDIQVTLQAFGLSVANPSPVTVDLTDTYITGYAETYGYCEGWVSIQTLNEYGQTLKTYQWMDDGQGEFAEWYGWYPEGAGDPSEKIVKGTVTVSAGEGLWTYCTEDGFYFNWPKVDVK